MLPAGVGVVGILSWSIGPIIAGAVMAKFKMTRTMALIFVVVINIIAVIGYATAMFISCPDVKWAGPMNKDE